MDRQIRYYVNGSVSHGNTSVPEVTPDRLEVHYMLVCVGLRVCVCVCERIHMLIQVQFVQLETS